MNGSEAVLDSNILIYFSKETLDFRKTCQTYKAIYISAISYMEVLGFKFKNKEERVLIKKFLNSMEILHTNWEITDKVVNYRQQSKIKIPDAIILATASMLNADLITNNPADFKGIDKNVGIVIPSLFE
ncbi:MAG: type II toxin-antitoxin system VapC family toxin [Cytophagales bacterium]|nr:type II toxin-antitoxin system VapC family toxin [Cytophagales bacterium]